MLEVSGLTTGYGPLKVVRDASLEVQAGEIVAVIGPNGSGKSTLLKGVTRGLPLTAGVLRFEGHDLTRLPRNQLAALGIGYVPQRGNVFPDLSVLDNLLVSSPASDRAARRRTGELFEEFPRLRDRRLQTASTLSGGERQMLAIACALMSEPRLLILDEPTTGLAPIIVAERIRDISRLADGGTGILWVIEEHPRLCLPAADRVHYMENGELGESRKAVELLADGALEELFFGVAG